MTENKKYSLYVVESPFQLLSAIEAKEYFKDHVSILVIRHSSNKRQNEQIDLLVDFTSWSEVITTRESRYTKEANLRLMYILYRLKRRHIYFENIFIGEYGSFYMKMFFNVLEKENCYMLDDGVATIDIQNNYLKYDQPYDKVTKVNERSEKVLHMLLRILFFTTIRKRVVNLFTCFDLEPVSEKQQVIAHNFDFLRNFSKNKKVIPNQVVFLGTFLSESGMMTLDEEVEILGKIKRYYADKGYTFLYAPHRHENRDKIYRLEKELDIHITTFKYPSEIEFLLNDTIPSNVASYFSTALFSLKKLITFESVETFFIPPEKIQNNRKGAIENIYKLLKKNTNFVDILQ